MAHGQRADSVSGASVSGGIIGNGRRIRASQAPPEGGKVTQEERLVRSDSDELLEALEDLRSTEGTKRGEDISTPPFHALADDVEAKAARVWKLAKRENTDGDRADTTDHSIDETPPLREN